MPTKANLTRRKKNFDIGCECCEDGVESKDARKESTLVELV